MSVLQGLPVPGEVESLQSWTEQSTVGGQSFCSQLSPAEVELRQLPAASEDTEDERRG